ncbi:SDR family oxidoreductase [Alphaproteobacteria bacterium]|nr:SDR family oxidoreductase [Alphaproteobacteria bacterium]
MKINKKKYVIVTGVNGQLGTDLVRKLYEKEYFIIGIDIKGKPHIKIKDYYNCNITNENEIVSFFKYLKKDKIFPEILINNAGIGTYGNIKTRTTEEIIKVMNVNMLGCINMIKNYYIHMSNLKKIKKIINISSIYGNYPPDFQIYKNNKNRYSSEIYGSTKAGIIQLTKYFAKNFSKENFIVNCISPGGIKNKKLQTSMFIKNYSKNVPLRRMANTSDIVMPILFLCSNDSNYINGHNLIVDGGLSC